MSKSSELALEAQQRFESSVQWSCPECEFENMSQVECPELDFSAEKSRDMIGEGDVSIQCDNCSAHYDGQAYANPFGVEYHFIKEDGSTFEATGDVPMYDPDYEDYWQPSDSPIDDYYVSMEGLVELTNLDSPTRHDLQFLNRVIFSHIITTLEAYLADTLRALVGSDDDVRLRLVSADSELKKDKFTAEEILTEPDKIKNHVDDYLKKLIYHNFPKIEALYRICVGISIFESPEHRGLMCQAAYYRHDCVHRNGKNTDGDLLTVYTKEYVDQIMTGSGTIVSIIDKEVNRRKAEGITAF